MLCLSRKTGERIVICTPDYDIEVVVVSVRGNCVRIGFEADKEVKILREEVQDRDDKR